MLAQNSRQSFRLRLNKFCFVGAAIIAMLAGGQLEASAQTQEKKLNDSQIARQWKRSAWEFDKSWKPISNEAVVQAWGEQAEKAFASKDINKILDYVDFKPLHNRCVAGVSNEDFKKGFMQGINSGTTNLLKQLSQSGSYVFRGVRNTEFGPCALMRMLDPAGGCNYHLWRLQLNDEGRVVGVDMYIFLSGETFGDTMRRITLLNVPKDDRTFFQKLSGKEQSMAEHQVDMIKMLQATQAQDHKAVLLAYNNLPGKLKGEKSFLVMRMTAAMQVDEGEYIEALEDYQKKYPGDASAALMGLDLYFLKKEFPKMYAALDQLGESVGKDAHLMMLRAVGLNMEGKLDEARKSIEEAMVAEPKLETPYWTFIEIALGQKDFAAVTGGLKRIAQGFGYSQFALEGNEMYTEYVKTDEYTKFKEYLKSVAK